MPYRNFKAGGDTPSSRNVNQMIPRLFASNKDNRLDPISPML